MLINLGEQKYKGIHMMTAAGVHEAIAQTLAQHYPKKNIRNSIRVVDMAAGKGALTQRLFDMGFTTIEAWDIETSQFVPKNIPFEKRNLEEDFTKK